MVDEHILRLSTLRHTWILDFDGTLVEHNGYKRGKDVWLPGALALLKQIPPDDFVIILTAREEKARLLTEALLVDAGIRYDLIIFDVPMGERILFNDIKPSGLKCAHIVAPIRDAGLENVRLIFDPAR